MKLLILIMVLSILATLPFVLLRRRWALVLWRRAKLVAVIYALIILTSAIVRLVFGWDDIYG
jgi:E3 ubiquitin-protein ligase DOA10